MIIKKKFVPKWFWYNIVIKTPSPRYWRVSPQKWQQHWRTILIASFCMNSKILVGRLYIILYKCYTILTFFISVFLNCLLLTNFNLHNTRSWRCHFCFIAFKSWARQRVFSARRIGGLLETTETKCCRLGGQFWFAGWDSGLCIRRVWRKCVRTAYQGSQ